VSSAGCTTVYFHADFWALACPSGRLTYKIGFVVYLRINLFSNFIYLIFYSSRDASHAEICFYDTQTYFLTPFRRLWGGRIWTRNSCVLCLVSPSCLKGTLTREKCIKWTYGGCLRPSLWAATIFKKIRLPRGQQARQFSPTVCSSTEEAGRNI
jgi:hypothetical protein